MSRRGLLGLAVLAGIIAGWGLGTLIRGDPVRVDGSRAWSPTAAVVAFTETGELDESLEALIDIVAPASPGPAEGGEISGRVIAADGRPVAGALVCARPSRSVPERSPEDASLEVSGDLRERVLAIALRERRAYQRERRAFTDARGCYVLTAIGDGTFEMTCWARGFEVAPANGATAWAGCPVDFVAKPLAEVLVEVRLPDGSSPAEASIWVSDGRQHSCDSGGFIDWGWERPWTPEHPRLRLCAGMQDLKATYRDETYASPPATVLIPPSGAYGSDPVVLRLAPDFRRPRGMIAALAGAVLPWLSKPAGGGKITGRVITADGRPVAGALVCADAYYSGPEPRNEDVPPEVSADLRERIRSFALRDRRAYQRERRAVTDARGCYVLTGIGDSQYDMRCWARGFWVEPEDSDAAWNARPGGPVDFFAKPTVEVPVEVLFPDGSRPAEAVVRVSSARGGSDLEDVDSTLEAWRWQHQWTPERPRLRLCAGVHALRATSEDRAYASPSTTVRVAPSGATGSDPVTLRLKAEACLEGRVVLPDGVDPHLYTLHFRRDSDVRPFLHDPGWKIGSFRFTGEDPGDYRLTVTLLGEGVVHSETVTLHDGESVERIVKVTAVPDLSGLVVRVFGPEGRVLPGVSVAVEGEHYSPRAMVASYVVIPRPDSSFVVRRTDRENERRPAGWIEVRAPTFGTRLVLFPESAATELSVHMESPGLLEVRAEDEGFFTRWGDLLLYPYPWSVDGYPLATLFGGWRGSGFCGPLQPGIYELRVDEGYAGATAQGTLVTVTSGRNQITIPGGPVLIPAGFSEALCIARDPDGRLGALGLQVGDLVTGVRERRFRGHLAPQTTLRDILGARDRVILLVRRDGHALEIAVNSAELSAAMFVAGVCEPAFEEKE